jgi:fatty-acid desaturase
VFFFNFCYAHIIALFLAGMSRINPGDNWMSSKGIDDQEWFEQYVWSYYWANTIMLTVGFGDLVASNYQEAICLIFIETFSCIMMAYNINCVGGIIANIRYQDQQRSKKFKIFKKLTDHNNVPPDLSFKINNYIE